jgi:hypothetical protein
LANKENETAEFRSNSVKGIDVLYVSICFGMRNNFFLMVAATVGLKPSNWKETERALGARQQPYQTAFLDKFLSLSKMLIHRVPTKIPTSSREKKIGPAPPACTRWPR